MVNSVNQYRFLCLRDPKEFFGRSHVCGMLQDFAPMRVFCRYGSCSYLDS